MTMNNIETANNSINKEIDILSLYTGKKGEYPQNYDALEKLKTEYDLLAKGAGIGMVISSCAALLGLVSPPISITGLGAVTITTEYLTRVGRLYEVTKMLLERFGDEGIKVIPRVKTDEGIIDLFIRMPDKRAFALVLRSNGASYVRWRKDKLEFYYRKLDKDGIKKWSSPSVAIGQLLQATTSLIKSKDPILGTTRSERNRPITKAIVFTSNTKLDSNNPPDLWVDFGQSKALKLDLGGSVYAVDRDNLINFLLPPLEKCDK
jgi:hypothetical protein